MMGYARLISVAFSICYQYVIYLVVMHSVLDSFPWRCTGAGDYIQSGSWSDHFNTEACQIFWTLVIIIRGYDNQQDLVFASVDMWEDYCTVPQSDIVMVTEFNV